MAYDTKPITTGSSRLTIHEWGPMLLTGAVLLATLLVPYVGFTLAEGVWKHPFSSTYPGLASAAPIKTPLGQYYMLLLSLVVGGIFPLSAIAYQLFQRNTKMQNLRRDFSLLGLDIGDNNDRADGNYVSHLDHPLNRWNYALQATIPTLISVLFLAIVIQMPVDRAFGMDLDLKGALAFGFFGSYVYCMQLIYRRYTTLDLKPTVYLNCAITLLAGFIFNFVAFEAVGALEAPAMLGMMGSVIGGIVAFSLGYFPRLAIRWFNTITYSALGVKQRQSDAHLLSNIDGISQLHEARLRDEGIDNLQNLVTARIDELLINTRFSAQQIVEWIDQAVLVMNTEPAMLDSFRRRGTRTISSFREMWQEYYPQPDAVEKMARTAKRTTAKPDEKQKIFDDARQHRALQFQTMPETLDILFSTTQAGPNMAYIENYWSNLRSVVKSRQDEVVSNAKLESKMPLAIVQVFHLIASEDIYSPSRTKLAGIASTMSEGVEGLEEIITGTDDPVAKAGFAWWVWRYAPDDIVFVKRPEHFYEQAILGDESVPGLYYELAHYYIVGRGNARRAFEAAKKAQGLAKDDDLQNLARVTTIAAGTILEASDERHLSNTQARTELEKLNGSVSDSKYRDHMSALAEVLRNKGATEIAEMLENQNGADS